MEQRNDLISRSALLADYDAAHKGPPGGARKLIEEAPAIDAAPVRHGRWVYHKGGYSDHYECTVCGEGIVLTARFRYCPNCGAKMEGDGDA